MLMLGDWPATSHGDADEFLTPRGRIAVVSP
jgi:hypothetical protein